MKKPHIWMLFGIIFVLFSALMWININSTEFQIDYSELNYNPNFEMSQTKMVSNITLILNYYDGDNVTFSDITLIGDISPYNATLVSLGDTNIDKYWAINGVFVKGLRINGTWYVNGNDGRNWFYYVDDVLPMMSSSVYELDNNSIIEWKFKSGSPFQGAIDPNDDFWFYTGLFIGITILCVIGIIFVVKRGV